MLKINKITSNPTVDFAAEELKKYLRMMMPGYGEIEIKYAPEAKDGFRLGLMADFGLDVSDAEDLELDDILYINTDKNGGIIAGDNPRSVLLSVYEFFRQNGCRWLMPGVDGEFIPVKDIEPVSYRFKPSLRYRGKTMGGAKHEDTLAIIDFMPKVGMNVFMMEFANPFVYYRGYYEHLFNENAREKEPVNLQIGAQWLAGFDCELKKRGIQFQAVGHGWNAEPFGIDVNVSKFDPDNDSKIKPEQRPYLALINGERKVFGNQPKWTQFCMAPKAHRSIVADYIVEFSKTHSYMDYIHVWLADGVNNHCECDECVKRTPSDWYIMLLNEIDEKLAAN